MVGAVLADRGRDSYCTAIDACYDLFDVYRGQAWTEGLRQWCAQQPDLVPFAGICQLHRAEFLQLRGDPGKPGGRIDDSASPTWAIASTHPRGGSRQQDLSPVRGTRGPRRPVHVHADIRLVMPGRGPGVDAHPLPNVFPTRPRKLRETPHWAGVAAFTAPSAVGNTT